MKADSDQAQIQDCNQGLGGSRSPLLPISQREAVLEQRVAENNQRWKDSESTELGNDVDWVSHEARDNDSASRLINSNKNHKNMLTTNNRFAEALGETILCTIVYKLTSFLY